MEIIKVKVKSVKVKVESADVTITDEDIKQIITDENSTKKLVQYAEGIGNLLGKELDKKDQLTTTQIRNVFGSVKKIEMKGFDNSKLLMLLPKLAYAAGRPSKTKGMKDLSEVLSAAIEMVDNNDGNFKRFVDFFEAILAYHRAAGGK